MISAPRNAERRRAIRETWLNLEKHLRSEVIHFFVVGRKGLHAETLESLEAESAENKDVLLLPNVEDSFDQLTTKVLATFLQLHKSVDFSYLLKVGQSDFVLRLDFVLFRMFLPHSSSSHSQGFKHENFGNSPGWWATTVATYCPSRPYQLTQKNITKNGK